jgi:PAS domain S-box-containing protein
MFATNEMLLLALHGAEVGTWEYDLASRENIWHESMAPVMGVHAGDVARAGRDFASYIHPDDAQRVVEKFTGVMQEPRVGVVWEDDLRVVRGDGQVRWVNTRGTIVQRPEGLRMIGIAIDITARKEAEYRLRESELRFRHIADSVPVLIWVAEGERLEFVNRAYYDFLGAPRDLDPNELRWFDYLHPEDRDRYLAEWQRDSREGNPFRSDMRFRRHDGEYRWTRSVALPRTDSTGRVVGYTGATIDIHEATLALAEQSAAGRRKDEFLAMLAHELRNPLAPLRNGAALLRRLGLQGPAADTARMIERQVGQMVRLLDDLLDVSRISRGRLLLQPERVPLARVFELSVETAKPAMEAAGHDFQVTMPPGDLVVIADRVRLSQAIINLLNNAAKFAEPGSRVTLHAERSEEQVQVVVRDTGWGIDAAELARIFEPGQRGSAAQAKSGLGLGLALARRLVEMHGGEITAASEGPGRGSEFRIALPLEDEPPPPERT